MSSLEKGSLAVVVIAGFFLLALGVASLLLPKKAGQFLLGFASSRSTHLTELFLRSVVGAALVLYAPRMAFSGAFNLFGWALLVTTSILFLLPWQWHHRMAQQAIPLFTRYVVLVGLVALVLGALILGAVLKGGEPPSAG